MLDSRHLLAWYANMATSARPPSRLRFVPFELEPSNRELRKSGVPLKLYPQPFRVLQLLLEHPRASGDTRRNSKGRLGRQYLCRFRRGINFAINQIRAALCDDPEAPRYIETVPRHGYRFIFPMTAVQAEVPVLAVGASHTIPHLHLVNDEMHTALDPATATAERQTAGWVRGNGLRSKPFVVALVALSAVVFSGLRLQSWFQVAKCPEASEHPNHAAHRKRQSLQRCHFSGWTLRCLRIARGGRLGLHLRQVATESDAQLLPREKTFFAGLTFSPDGEYIYFVRSDKTDPALHSLYKMPLLGGTCAATSQECRLTRQLLPGWGSSFPIPEPDRHTRAQKSGLPMPTETMNRRWPVFRKPGRVSSLARRGRRTGVLLLTSIMHLGSEKGFTLRVISLARGEGRDLYSTTRQIGRPRWLHGGNALLAAIDDDHGQLWTISYPDGKASQITNDH